MIKLLVVDDSALMRKVLRQVFASETDFQLEFAKNGVEALSLNQSFAPDVITLDVNMPEMDGLVCLDRIMVERPCAVVMVSSLTAEAADATVEALRIGAVDFIAKPDAVSLRTDDFTPALVAKVRSAASAKMRPTLRLRERLRHRAGAAPRTVAKRSRRATVEARSGEGVVLIGCSTGGPPALETVLTTLPQNFSWPIVIAQHMPASFTGALARRLDGVCQLDVVEVSVPAPLEPGCAYIARGDCDIVISRRAGELIVYSAPSEPYPWHPSVDRLVRSAMETMPASHLIGVLMTGMGNDGAQAMTRLHAEGGRTIAEAEESAVIWGMPGELAKAGGADWIVPVTEIAPCLEKLVA